MLAKAIEAIAIQLVGWRGVKSDDGAELPFDPAKLRLALTKGEIIELRNDLRMDTMVAYLNRRREPEAAKTE